ncbi:MAG: hypothetical protein RIE58_02325, partial [Vicingaceae bacterium]
WTYDSEGRETGYKYYTNGNLDQENINYQHDEKGNAKYLETMANGELVYKHTRTFKCFEVKVN